MQEVYTMAELVEMIDQIHDRRHLKTLSNKRIVLPDEFPEHMFPERMGMTVVHLGEVFIHVVVRCAECETTSNRYYLRRDSANGYGWHKFVTLELQGIYQVADVREADFVCDEHTAQGGIPISITALIADGDDTENYKKFQLLQDMIRHRMGRDSDE